MKRRLGVLVLCGLVSLLALGCAGLSQEVKKEGVSFVVTTPVVELGKEAKVVMYGTGFAPKQEIMLMFVDNIGVPSVIMVESLKPVPVANKEGAWATVWSCAPYLQSIPKGTVMINVTDKDYRTLASAPVAFMAPAEKKK